MDKVLKLKEEVERIDRYITLFKRREIKKGVFKKIDLINDEIDKIIESKNLLEKDFSILENAKLKIEKENKKLKAKFEKIIKKYEIIENILSAKNSNKSFEEFKRVIKKEFLPFANSEKSVSNEAEIMLEFHSIIKELELISAYPKLYTKNIIAVGGGFSAGKSEFISSFIKSDSKLPIGLKPTTAIPTYVTSGREGFFGINYKGGIAKFDKEKNYLLSHEFIKSFSFNLKDIMPFMIFTTKLEKNLKNICFIDTPGYNPTGKDYLEDINITKEFLKESSSLIWVIGLDSNGTIPNSDLEFLKHLNLDDKKLFIVLNKADLRIPSEIKNIIENVVGVLEDNFINFEGISAYSSIMKKEISFYNMSLFEFFELQNFEMSKYNEILQKLKNIYLTYKKAIENDIKKNKTISKILNSISLDVLEEGGSDKTINKIEELKKEFNINDLKKSLKTLDDVFEKIYKSLDKIFSQK